MQLTKLQNLFRGLVSLLRSSAFTKSELTPLSQRYRVGIKRIYLQARVVLPQSRYAEFVDWIEIQEQTILSDIIMTEKSYEYLSGVGSSKKATLEVELRWLSSLLRKNVRSISEVRMQAEMIEKQVLFGDLSQSLLAMRTIERKVGVSLWSVQLSIALTQEVSGLEAQKRLAAELQSVFRKGLLGFVAYHSSVRNEPRTSATRFNSDTLYRIDSHKNFSNEVKHFLRNQLLNQIGDHPNDLAAILRVSQSHHFIDQYEAFVAVCQKIVATDELAEYSPIVADCLGNLDQTRDFRLDKLRAAITETPSERTNLARSNRVLNSILDGKFVDALRAFTCGTLDDTSPDVWDYIYVGWAMSEGYLKPNSEKRIYRRCVRFIAAMFTDTDLFDPHDALVKLTRNFSQLPFFASLNDYSNLVNGAHFVDEMNHLVFGLNSPYIGFEDLNNLMSLKEFFATLSDPNDHRNAFKLWRCFLGDAEIHPVENKPSFLLASALGSSARGDQSALQHALTKLQSSDLSGAVKGIFDLVELSDGVNEINKQRVIELISSSCSRFPYSPLWHRVECVLEAYKWPDYVEAGNPVSASVALHMLLQSTQTSETASILRFSVGSALKSLGVAKPSDLDWRQPVVEKDVLIYFLDYVCVPNIIDVTRAFRGSREVLEERGAICKLLANLNVEHESYHLSEASNIEHDLTIADGQLIVDSSRIYVDIPQLKQWAKNNVAEDYSRYRDLSQVEVEKFRPIEEVLADIIENPIKGQRQFKPESEADILLYSILVRVTDEFLMNPTFGLDFFLSKRIRHQSFIGSIRGPLEFADLITTRSEADGTYRPNHHWADQLTSISQQKEGIVLAFQNFAARFDASLLDAKDSYFQVRTKEAPSGLIYLSLTTSIVEVIKAMVPIDSSFEDFLDAVEALLWAGLESALAVTRSFITEDLKDDISGATDELKSEVRRITDNTEEFLAFDAEIGKRSNEVQVKLEEAAAWFKRVNLDSVKSFELDEAIEVAQKSALSSLPRFKPDLEDPVTEADMQIQAHSLVLIHDIIQIAFQNAKDHSGLDNPQISISASALSGKGILSVRIESEVKRSFRDKAAKGASDKAKLIEEGRSAFRARKEGGSGFFKLSAVASQSSRGHLDFGMGSSGRFFLEVDYSLIVMKHGSN